jgi:hypothetical protein
VNRRSRIAGAALAAMLALAGPAMGAGSSLSMLDQLSPGRWEVRYREAGVPPQRLCLSSGQGLIQLRHPGAACERFVVEDGPGHVVVQYTCKGRGYGRTHIRKESAQLAQISSQGIAGGLPFEFTAEARRVGDCNGS